MRANLWRMKTLAAIGLALLACSQKPPPPAPLTVKEVAAPRDTALHDISGFVTARDRGSVTLDSGGPNPIPLRIDAQAPVILDGKAATASDIQEGDLVRAAYKLSDSGEPLALEVVANSHSVSTRGPSR